MQPQPRLAQVIAQYLRSLPPEEQSFAQQELGRLLRWFGSDSTLAALSPQELANFAQGFAPNDDERRGKAIKDFLAYLKRQGLTTDNLGKHFRLPRPSRRVRPVPAPESAAPPVQLTAEGMQRIQAELDTLHKERVALAEEVRRAAADKDVRENAPLAAARERLAWVVSRIQELEGVLRQAQVMAVATATQERRKIAPGCTVALRDMDTGKEVTYTLVDPRESSAWAGRISIESPVGKALLDHYEGDEVEVRVPKGITRYRILRVS
ncbi:MAG: transcription elongation factor GreA [Dehalococcoidia bacterium]|nr:transcription elongation factor GreA [Dehalococcoidia bacterium]MDW8119825.1 transcription elongation factor GreA [Chloroflexota bacterium]